jgi:hypothetical protein
VTSRAFCPVREEDDAVRAFFLSAGDAVADLGDLEARVGASTEDLALRPAAPLLELCAALQTLLHTCTIESRVVGELVMV